MHATGRLLGASLICCVVTALPAWAAQTDKEGYPLPGTKATEEFGKKAEYRATTEVNKEMMGDCVKAQPGMGKDRAGYPMPGTTATEQFGKQAEQQATKEVNKEFAEKASQVTPCPEEKK